MKSKKNILSHIHEFIGINTEMNIYVCIPGLIYIHMFFVLSVERTLEMVTLP